jgi:serine/threonine protein kinase/tetratricopeptide (TPR) repeat protein
MTRTSSREEALFTDAIALPQEQRAAFLEGACRGDPALRERVRALLEAHAEPDSLLAGAGKPPAAVHEEKQGDRIGHYKLLQKLGEGGCGVVWMAEQEEPVRRRVALKIIKLGMDTKAVVARFEAERQALALMDHPNIAKVHDAGSTDGGRPYFVMELVRGIPITKYCDENHLTPAARLELFIQICQAVQHAHQKGIIHRDLKPSNILVTVNDGAPTPKIIDFGIAKATQGRLTDATVFTAFEQFIGTPVYMSPEQAEMSSLDIDTRSDIYSLGVLLYELLTGRPPFDPKKFAAASVDQIRQQIREVEPPRPSARLRTLTDEEQTTIARLRSTAPSNLSIILRGDLDWVVMRCIEKDRTRRYDTANGLAADIQRYLRNEPVVARPPSTTYLLQKLVRRHKVGFASGAVVIVALVIGMVVSVRQRAVAVQARAEAESARSKAEDLVGGFLLAEFYDDLTPTIRLKTIAKLAERAVAYYDGLPPALVTRDTERNRATALMQQGTALMNQADTVRWGALIDRAIADFEKLRAAGDTSEQATVGLALALHARGWAKLRAWGSGAADIERAVGLLRPLATGPRGAIRIQREFANLLNNWSAWQLPERGIPACEESRQILRRLGALELNDLTATSGYVSVTDTAAWLMLSAGRIDEAERLALELIALGEKIAVAEPGNLAAVAARGWGHNKLYIVQARRFHATSALDVAHKCIQATDDWVAADRANAEAWSHRISSRHGLAEALRANGRVADAELQLHAAIKLDADAPRGAEARFRTPNVWLDVASLAAQRGDRGAAEHACAEAARAWETLNDDNKTGSFGRLATHEFVEQYRRVIGLAFHEFGEVKQTAQAALVRIDAMLQRPELPIGRKREIEGLRRAALGDLVKASSQVGRFAEAEATARVAVTSPQGDGTYVSLETSRAEAQALLALALARQSRAEEARAALAPALRVYRDLQNNGAGGVDFDRDLAFCLYVQAIASADDEPRSAERGAALDEAVQLLNRLSDEAKSLRDVHELRRLVGAERAEPDDE